MSKPYVIPQASDVEDIEDVLKDINGNICGPIDRFFLKYFPHSQVETPNTESQPVVPGPEDFVQWFVNFFALKSGKAQSEWHISNQVILTPQTTEVVHLFLSTTNGSDVSADHQWGSVQVVGEFCLDSVNYQYGLLNLCSLARHTFARQPTRLFLHGFYIYQSTIELWVFDRSGIYGGKAFNIQDRSQLFVEVINGYCSMSSEQLGRSSVLQTDESVHYIVLEDPRTAILRKIYLAERPVTNRRDLVGGGTTCYLAKDSGSDHWQYAVKFKWRFTYEEPEDVMLNLLRERNVRNVVRLVHHREMETIADLRSTLRFDRTRRFLGIGTTETPNEHHAHQGIVSHTEETRNRFQNRTFTYVVTSPVGKPLHTFQTVIELVQTLRDAVIAHRSLLKDAGVLHQDVSEGNILIRVTRENEGDSTGILIDYDVATRLEDQAEDMQSIAGTTLFMAIGVLKGLTHTYRHDLESFFYVLLRTVIASREASGDLPEKSKLVAWTGSDFDENARVKTRDMAEGHFRGILDEFPSDFQNLRPLAERLRGLLFASTDGTIYTGTDHSPEAIDSLYDGFIGALEAALVDLRPT